MRLKDMFKKNNYISVGKEPAVEVPEGLWSKCCNCGELVYTDDIINSFHACPKCGYYSRIDAKTRISMVTDKGTFTEWDTGIDNNNPLDFDGYESKIAGLKDKTGLDEAVITGKGTINGNEAVICVCDTRFLMGSMGYVVGEKITRAFERATEEKLPVIVFTCSGGARMQEGIVSLMQMAKTSAAIKKHDAAGLLYITVLTDPTTGGVTASFAMLGDIILAEPGALVGFAGPRVIKQTIGEELPEGFQRAEFLLEHGLIDGIVERKDLKETLGKLLLFHKTVSYRGLMNYQEKLDGIWKERNITYEESDLEAWDRVLIARDNKRPSARAYINSIFKEFYELHGDRAYRDDGAIIGGIALFGNMPVTVIGQQKGSTTKENIKCNFGMPYPEGYRKALRLMKQAEKFHRPIICFVDTPGAFCGIGAEERGQGEAIARNLYEMSSLSVPVLSIVIGEGGSGGALALAVANQVWMMENAVYSILSPEGFASIMWKDSKRASEASEVMKITAADLKRLGIIEDIIPEFPIVTEEKMKKVSFVMKKKICDFLLDYSKYTPEQLISDRYDRFRRM